MPNIAQVLKEEIRRLSKQQARLLTSDLKKTVVRQKRFVADLKRRIARLEKDNRWLVSEEKLRQQHHAPVIAAGSSKARLTSKGVRAMRRKLGLSQAEFGKLVGVTAVSVGNWEKGDGALRLRDTTRAGILSLRGIGAREAKKRLEVLTVKI